MKISTIYVLLLCNIIFNQIIAMDQKSAEDYRPGNIFKEIEVDSYPNPKSTKDCIQLCQSLIKIEVQFWKETQALMIEGPEKEKRRLKSIVAILSENSMDIFLRLKILQDTNDHDLYDIFNSYDKIINNLRLFSKLLSDYEIKDKFSDYQEECYFIRQIIKLLSKKNKEINNRDLHLRGLIQGPILGKSIYDVQQEQRGKFQGNFREN